MLDTQRDTQLQEALTVLRAVKGVQDVQSDDWDSVSINILVYPIVAYRDRDGGRPMRFDATVGVLKRRIRLALEKAGFAFNWLDWPAKLYDCFNFRGERTYSSRGYDKDSLKLEIIL